MKQFLFSISLISVLFYACTPKETLTPSQRLIGKYRLVWANCGTNPDSFVYHSFSGIQFNEDGTGLDVFDNNTTRGFEYAVSNNVITLCPTTSSVSDIIPFGFSHDTLYMKRGNNICSQLVYRYVKL
jgi:hypothetical protein